MFLYDLAISTYALGARISALWSPKAKLWCEGRKGLLERLAEAIPSNEEIVWIHVASLGEFEQGRPIIEKIHTEHPEYKILITFFSPSGYEIRRNYEGGDYIFYLPIDTLSNVKRFLDIINPKVAIFVKYEFWLNLLGELRSRGIKSYIVSSIFRTNSIFFKPWGGAWREALEAFETIFVQDDNSKKLLSEWGFDNVVVAGDTRFDRVWDIAQHSKDIPIIERFAAEKEVFIAGSTWCEDEEILIPLTKNNPDVKFIIAPHEIGADRVNGLISKLQGRGVRYSEITELYDLKSIQVLVLDTMGMLSSVYKYAQWGYIGGGFGKGIHNTLEAATFGLPIAFGPNYLKFKEACDLISLGAAQSVCSVEELTTWFSPLKENSEFRNEVSHKALDFTSRRRGATNLITKSIFR